MTSWLTHSVACSSRAHEPLAFRHQDCEQDVDVARMLEYGVGDRLSVQLDCVAEVVEALSNPAGKGTTAETPEEELPSIQ